MSISLMRKVVDFDRSPLLFAPQIRPERFELDWEVFSGHWQVEGEWLTGRHRENSPGMVLLSRGFPGDVLVEFEARTLSPSTHDINFMWNGSWDMTRNERGVAYVAGLQGWWDGKVGIEKSPEYKLNVGTPLFDFKPGQTYLIQGGSIGGHCFIAVDGRLLLEVTDPDPIDSQRYDRIGFEAYCSQIQIRNVRIRQLAWTATDPAYTPEF